MKKIEKPHDYKKTPIDKFCEILMLSLLPFLVFICLIILLSTKSHAMSSSKLPYYVDYYRSSFFDSSPENSLYYNVLLTPDMRWCGEPYQYNNTYRVALYYVNFNSNTFDLKNHSLNTTIDYDMFNFQYDYVVFYNVNYILFELQNDGNFHQVGNNMSDGVSSSVAIMGKGSASKNTFGWTSNIPHQLKNGVSLYYNSDVNKIVFTNGVPNVNVPTGHAIPPDNFNSPVYPNNHVPPHNVPPHYTINNYIWTNTPNLDFSTLENGVNSIGQLIMWLANNLHNEFSNLIDNIKGLFEYIGDTLNYYGDLIIDNIQNLINTFYYNMVSLVENIGNTIDYISQPLDMSNLTNIVNSTQIWGDVDTCTTYANDAFGIYGTVSEPNTFKIPLDLRSISLLNITQVYYIDLSWLDGAKTAIRAFMWCVVTFGLLYSVIVDIPNMIRSSK